MENAKRLMSVFLSVLMFLSCLVVVPLTVNAVSSYTMPLNSTNLKSVGAQDRNGVACSCFALAYCRTILDGKAHSFSEYNKYGNSQTNVDCIWGNGNATKRTANSAKAVLKACYDYVNSNTPVVIHVNTSTGQHWVAVVGYQNVSDSNNMSYNNLIIIDPWYGYPQKKNGYSIHSDYAYVTPNDKGVSAHTHNYNTFVEYQSAHPHYAVYKCSCGATQVDKSKSEFNPTCNSCITGLNAEQTISDGEYLIASAIDQSSCLNVASSSKESGANVHLWKTVSDDNVGALLIVKYIGDGYYSLTFKNSGKALDVYQGYKAPGTNVQQYTPNTSNSQKWVIRPNDDNYTFSIVSRCNGLYLDAKGGTAENGTNIQVYTGNNSKGQKWRFIRSGMMEII